MTSGYLHSAFNPVLAEIMKTYQITISKNGKSIDCYELTAKNMLEAYYIARRTKYWKKQKGTLRCYLKKD